MELEGGVPTHLGPFGGPIHFNTQVIPIFLPVQLAVHHVEQIPNPDLLSGGKLHQGHPGRDIFVLRHPKGYDVTPGRPREVPAERREHSISRPLARMLWGRGRSGHQARRLETSPGFPDSWRLPVWPPPPGASVCSLCQRGAAGLHTATPWAAGPGRRRTRSLALREQHSSEDPAAGGQQPPPCSDLEARRPHEPQRLPFL